MTFECTLVRAPGSLNRTSPAELTVDVEQGVPGTVLQNALQQSHATGNITVHGHPIGDLIVGQAPLVDGAVLVDSGMDAAPDKRRRQHNRPPLLLSVHTGPGAGMMVPLSRGTFRLGRGPVDVPIPDPGLSRSHALLHISDTEVAIVDDQSANGVHVDNRRIRKARLSTDSVLRCGSSAMSIGFLGEALATAQSMRVIRSNGLNDINAEIVIRKPGDGPKTVPLLLTAIVPLLLGVGLALLTGSWMFLALTAVSAVTVLVSVFSTGRQRKAFAVSVADAASADEVRRRHAAPSAAQLLAIAMNDANEHLEHLEKGHSGEFSGFGHRHALLANAGEDRCLADAVSMPSRTAASDVTRSADQDASRANFEMANPRLRAPSVPMVPPLRFGTADQPARIRLEPREESFKPPTLPALPVVANPSEGVISICGRKSDTHGLVRFLLMQASTSINPLTGPRIVVLGPGSSLPASARFLPGAVVTSSIDSAADCVRGVPGGGRVMIVLRRDPSSAHLADDPGGDNPPMVRPLASREEERPRHRSYARSRRALSKTGHLDVGATSEAEGSGARGEAKLAELAISLGWAVVVVDQMPAPGASTVVDLRRRPATLRTTGSELEFVPDSVSQDVFDRFCRASALRRPQRSGKRGIPESVELADLQSFDPSTTARRWSANEQGKDLIAVLGAGAESPVSVDLLIDGPHLLVAGTTGSGKSELLRTLVSSLALGYSPDTVNFLFVDFKGGSGLGPLSKLPHCVGLLTDLDAGGLARSLASLRAEVKRREAAFAEAGTQDLRAYRHGMTADRAPLPHLVLVVDEFRMLVDEAPAALGELMRIAAIGRSLGIHLVMATQRPQGALTMDIRANVTTAIALRVQSDMESVDIIGTKDAAAIPQRTPGRALLARGSDHPMAFQTARISVQARGQQPPVRVKSFREAALAPPGTHNGFGKNDGDDKNSTALAANVTNAVAAAWTLKGGHAPRLPVAQPLPERLTLGDAIHGQITPPRDVSPTTVTLGLADYPERQETLPLNWCPSTHGHLGLVGVSSAVSGACLAVTASIAAAARESHMYILDSDGSFAGAELTPRTGAVARIHEPRRAARILRRLVAEMQSRLSAGRALRPSSPTGVLKGNESSDAGVSMVQGIDPVSPDRTPLILVIHGWGTWLSCFRSGPLNWAEELAYDLARDGSAAGITIITTGDRELSTSRLGPLLPSRAYFPEGSSEESKMAWPSKLPTAEPLQGRAVVTGALGGKGTSTPVTQLFLPPEAGEWPYGSVPKPQHAPFHIEALPDVVGVTDMLRRPSERVPGWDEATSSKGPIRLVLGLEGDELVQSIVTLRQEDVFLAIGGPESGKSTFLETIQEANPHVPWLSANSGPDSSSAISETLRRLESDAAARNVAILVDDADTLPHATQQHLLALSGLCRTMVLTASPSPSLVQRLPVAVSARNSGTGVILRPRVAADCDFFMVRTDLVDQAPPPGRAILLRSGSAVPIQTAAPDRILGGTAAHFGRGVP
ncbi:FtsK/SpoIIIE domain-containing protein [Arthrobacter sp. M4]|uniref:FtsK/SpoIIIE domain-containing protein n=1 Tax=Arthrobacter sp. M4 TaxID=218160 RepID=UPI001CDD3E64|nr:FtsK/SpoIIIE domain-containing protein [Arthrobacter sp. M4]MCA4132267.1 FHA domain-containing protein [Arthrobacter sp. M4]